MLHILELGCHDYLTEFLQLKTLLLFNVVEPFKRDFDLFYHLNVSNLLSHCILVCKMSHKIVK